MYHIHKLKIQTVHGCHLTFGRYSPKSSCARLYVVYLCNYLLCINICLELNSETVQEISQSLKKSSK